MYIDNREYRRVRQGPGAWTASLVIGLGCVQKLFGGKRFKDKHSVTNAIKAHAEARKVSPLIIDGQPGE